MAEYEHWRGTLSLQEQRCYDLFRISGSTVTRMIPMPVSDQASVMHAFLAFMVDHPECYDFSGEIKFQWESNRLLSFGARSLSILLCPLYDPIQKRFYARAMQERLQAFDRGITAVYGDLERERYIVDFISQGATYEIREPFTCTASGALVDRRAQCIGFAKACKLLCDRIGLRCLIAQGNFKRESGGIGHAWNIVWIDGQCYHLDVTGLVGNGGIEQCKSFFNQTDRQLEEQGYSWERGPVPVCEVPFDRGRFASDTAEPCFRDLFSVRSYLQQELPKRPQALSFFLNLPDRSGQALLSLVKQALSSELKKQGWYVGYRIHICVGIAGDLVRIDFSS